MPLEDLEQYGSDSGSGDYSPDSDIMPNYRKQNSDSYAFSLDSGDNSISAQKFDRQSD
jgi:hypothetical protein